MSKRYGDRNMLRLLPRLDELYQMVMNAASHFDDRPHDIYYEALRHRRRHLRIPLD